MAQQKASNTRRAMVANEVSKRTSMQRNNCSNAAVRKFLRRHPFAFIVRVVGAKVATKKATQGRLLKNSWLLKNCRPKKWLFKKRSDQPLTAFGQPAHPSVLPAVAQAAFFSLYPCSYQPPPFRANPAWEINFATDPPHATHSVREASENFCLASKTRPQS